MKLTVRIGEYHGEPISGAIVQMSAPQYDLVDLGAESNNAGVVEFELPSTYDDAIYVMIYVDGIKKWEDYVPSEADTIYLT